MDAADRPEDLGAIRVERADDPRIADYVGLTDPDLRKRVEADEGFFIVEGVLAIERLFDSAHPPRSFLLTDKAFARLGPAALATGAAVYVASAEVLRSVVGFDLHRGAVASADRPGHPSPTSLLGRPGPLLVLEGVNDHENLGALFRNAAAFGAAGVLADPTTADPLYRRSVRVSMGHVLTVPFARSERWPGVLDEVRAAGRPIVALTPDPSALAIDDPAVPHGDVALLLGAEGPGLTASALAAADVAVRIPMAPGVDSLNVATAAAVALHRLYPHPGGTDDRGPDGAGR